MPLTRIVLAIIAGLALAGPVQAQHTPAPPSERTVDIQGDTRAFMYNAHMRAFYDLTVATLGPGAPPLDAKTYETKAFAIFRAFGNANGGNGEGMVDHLKLIPGQVIQIVKDDPSVLDSFDSFVVAMIGPG